MIEYNNYNEQSSQTNSDSDHTSNASAEGKTSSMGFRSSAQERAWMDQVRRECVRGYTNRIR